MECRVRASCTYNKSKSDNTPTALENITSETPLRRSSASQSGAEQSHDEAGQRILEELTGRFYYNVTGFYGRYFEGKTWMKKTMDICEEAKARNVQSPHEWLARTSKLRSCLEWLMMFQMTVRTELRHKYYIPARKVLRCSEAGRMPDVFLASACTLPDGEHIWSNVLVIGELKSNPNEDRSPKTLAQLAGYAREVFGS